MARIHWVDVLIAPLTWLERTRGRRRLALLMLYALILAVGGALIGREAVLWQLPGAPEPFDRAKYSHVGLADSDNAMVLYAQAVERLVSDKTLTNLPKGVGQEWDWRRADPKLRAWAESNQVALDLWLKGSERLDALLVQPEQSVNSTPLNVLNALRTLAQLGTLEATMRQDLGDLEGAWTNYHALIRSGLHAGRHGGVISAGTSSAILRLAIPQVIGWVDDPRVTPALLRHAIADLAGCRALMPSAAELIRVEYLWDRANLSKAYQWGNSRLAPDDPFAWTDHLPAIVSLKVFLANEPKRSLKVLRLITAGQLAQSDRPPGDRPPVVNDRYMIYAIDARTPANLTRIKPQILAGWARACSFRANGLGLSFAQGAIRAIEGQLDQLRMRMAERAFQLDHGGQPARTFGDLFPAYLDALPAGITAGDLLAAP